MYTKLIEYVNTYSMIYRRLYWNLYIYRNHHSLKIGILKSYKVILIKVLNYSNFSPN